MPEPCDWAARGIGGEMGKRKQWSLKACSLDFSQLTLRKVSGYSYVILNV